MQLSKEEDEIQTEFALIKVRAKKFACDILASGYKEPPPIIAMGFLIASIQLCKDGGYITKENLKNGIDEFWEEE